MDGGSFSFILYTELTVSGHQLCTKHESLTTDNTTIEKDLDSQM